MPRNEKSGKVARRRMLMASTAQLSPGLLGSRILFAFETTPASTVIHPFINVVVRADSRVAAQASRAPGEGLGALSSQAFGLGRP